jgi:hypothetical protein
MRIGRAARKKRFCRQFIDTDRRFAACDVETARRMADFQADLLRLRSRPALAGAALSGWRLFPAGTQARGEATPAGS